MEPQDDLALRIGEWVKTQVPPEQVAVVTRGVCLAVATLMGDPAFTNELVVVKQLREENRWLRTQYQILKQMMDKVGVRTSTSKPRSGATKSASTKQASSRKASPRKSPSPSKASSARSRSSNAAAFKDGFREMRP